MMSELKITDYIPQRPPIVMIDGVEEIMDAGVTSTFKVRSEHLFCNKGFLSTAGIIENIAQTAAFLAGYLYKNAGADVPLGFISSIKSLEVRQHPTTGQVISTKLEKLQDVLDFSIFQGRVFGENQVLVAQCELRIFTQKIENAPD
jgi:predicted hotdog family 3-hydroxylacyl-ACP dehydratase